MLAELFMLRLEADLPREGDVLVRSRSPFVPFVLASPRH
jgi:hypothetical protein